MEYNGAGGERTLAVEGVLERRPEAFGRESGAFAERRNKKDGGCTCAKNR